MDEVKKLAGKAVEAMPALARTVVDAILSFLFKALKFLSED